MDKIAETKCPIQVTRYLPMTELIETSRYLKSHGFVVIAVCKTMKKKPMWALFRSLSEREKEEIRTRKYKIENDCLVQYKTASHNQMKDCVCVKCRRPYRGSKTEKLSLCRVCQVGVNRISGGGLGE